MSIHSLPRAERDVNNHLVHDARTLVGDGQTATILLDGQAYCLRITRLGKLILTK